MLLKTSDSLEKIPSKSIVQKIVLIKHKNLKDPSKILRSDNLFIEISCFLYLINVVKLKMILVLIENNF
jgi:hypothetical protein